MKTVTIQVPGNCKVQTVKKEEKKEPVIRTYQDLIDHNIIINNCYWITEDSEICKTGCYSIMDSSDKNVAASEKVAKSMLAMAQISQLMPYYGGEVTKEEWENESIFKYSIRRVGNYIGYLIQSRSIYPNYFYLTFHTESMMKEFLKYNEQLVKDYLMID